MNAMIAMNNESYAQREQLKISLISLQDHYLNLCPQNRQKVHLPNADDENLKSSVPLIDNICDAL